MKKQWFLLCIFSLLLVSSALGAYRYYSPYGYSGSYGGFGDLSGMFGTFIDFLVENQFVVDAVLFLVVYLMVAKKVFYKSFSEDKLLYIVFGVGLTIGLMVYERNILGHALIVESGWASLIVLAGLILYMVSKGSEGLRMMSFGVAGLVGFGWLISEDNWEVGRVLNYLPAPVPILFLLACSVALLYGFYKLIKGRGITPSGGHP